jgi:hypothetical protein
MSILDPAEIQQALVYPPVIGRMPEALPVGHGRVAVHGLDAVLGASEIALVRVADRHYFDHVLTSRVEAFHEIVTAAAGAPIQPTCALSFAPSAGRMRAHR